MNFKEKSDSLVTTIQKYKHILICIKGSPDPDAMASSYVLKLICESFGVRATIDSPISPSLKENSMLLQDLHLPIHFKPLKNNTKSYDGYAILDFPNTEVEELSDEIPCAIHIDHHDPPSGLKPADFQIQTTAAGSTSTLIALILKELEEWVNFSADIRINAATALYFGIYTDTTKLEYVTDWDKEALDLLDPYLDKPYIHRVCAHPAPQELIQLIHQSLSNYVMIKDWLVSGLGYIKASQRDHMAIISDFLLKKENISKVLVFCIVEKPKGLMLDASLRTNLPNINLNNVIKHMSQEGGARPYKGAFQIDLNYFTHCPDRGMLWKVVSDTTVEAIKKYGSLAKPGLIKTFLNLIPWKSK